MTDTFIMRGEWIKHVENMPLDMQDKITAEICRYGAGIPLKYEDDAVISSFVNFVKGSIDNDKIYELALKGYTAQEIANELGVSKSSIDKSEGWKKRKEFAF